jgi:topoisomerase-4 subunit A
MLIDVKGWKAIGNKLSLYPVKDIALIQAEKITEAEVAEVEHEEESIDPDQALEIGSKVDLSPKKEDDDQLGLF